MPTQQVPISKAYILSSRPKKKQFFQPTFAAEFGDSTLAALFLL